ncbi:MAG TPA: prolyl oligopeptidase family serine peptidase, partial [Micromonospora sp.]
PPDGPTRPVGPTTGGGITDYAVNPTARVAVFTLGGRLFRADLVESRVTEVPVDGPVTDARPDPTGRRLAYVTGDPAVPLPGGRGNGNGHGNGGNGGNGHGNGNGGGGNGGGGSRSGEPWWPGQLRVVDPDGTDVLLAGENSGVTWGRAEYVARRQFGRCQGYWWAPDGLSLLAARVDESRLPRWHQHDPGAPETPPTSLARPRPGGGTAEVSLHLLDLDGGWVDVHWDRETYPYLVSVHWGEGVPLITVLRRMQQHGLVLAVDPRTGETQVHAELADPRWVEPIPGTPSHLPDGRVLVGGELAHDGYDARCLFADGTLLTPPSLYIRRVVGQLRARHGPPDLLVEGSEGDPGQQHLFRVRTAIGGGGVDARRLTTEPGWHTAEVGGDLLVVGSATLEQSGVRWTVFRGDRELATIRSVSANAPYQPEPFLERVTDRRLPAAVLYPREHVTGRRLPVLLATDAGPGRQEVRAARSAWLERQWWADAGFAVVTVDTRGTPGVAPSYEKVIHRRLADVILTDHLDALTALADKHPDLDLGQVAVRGRGFGGWLAGIAALRRPELFRCAVSRSPITDWARHDSVHAERYLGMPEESAEIYAHHSLLELAGEPVGADERACPLLLVHGMADDTVPVAHTLLLSAALVATGRPHGVLPVTGVGDLDADAAGDRLLRLELDFVRRHL